MGRRRRNPRADSGGGGSSGGGGGGSGSSSSGVSWTDEALSASAAAVSFALLLTGSLLAQPCLSAPTVTRLDPRPWHYPCGDNKQESGVTSPQSPQRHLAIKALKRVRTQMRIASVHYEKEKSAIDLLHEELKEFKDSAITYSWLPDKQFAWYQAEARCQERHKRLAIILPQLHTSLQRYLVTLEEVNRFPHAVNEPQQAAKSRKKVLFELSKELKKWLCEVETALNSSRITVPSRTKEDIIPRDDLDRWHSEPSHTTSLVQTWGVLTAYRRFTQEWQKIFNEALKDTVPASCPGQKQTSKKQPKTSKPASNGKQPAKKGKPVGPKKPLPAASKNTPTAVRKTTTKKRRPGQPKN